jgi:hypothetical protein
MDGNADRLEEGSVMGLDGSAQECQVTIDSDRHRAAVRLPERGAALDVGEEEGDSS